MNDKEALIHNVIISLIENNRDIDAIENETKRIVQLSESLKTHTVTSTEIPTSIVIKRSRKEFIVL